MYNQIILQYSRNYHNIANQLYFKSVNKTVTSDAPSGLQIKTNLIFFHLHLPQPDFFFFSCPCIMWDLSFPTRD